jgi:hypothetical protein
MCFGDSFGNKVAPLEIRGYGAMIAVGPVFFRVTPAAG